MADNNPADLTPELQTQLDALLRALLKAGIAPANPVEFKLTRHSVSHKGTFKGMISFTFGGGDKDE